MTALYVVGAILVGFAGFGIWLYSRGRQSAKGDQAIGEANRRREEDKIDALPMDTETATDIARKLAGARGVHPGNPPT